MDKQRILVLEDEEKIARFVELELTYEGYEVDKAYSGREGLEMARNGGYSLILLDVMLPELNGMEVLRRLRQDSEVPVIMVTARDSVVDKVAGLDGGADDYITKPFAIEELLARIRNILKKTKREREEVGEVITVGDLWLNKPKREVRVGETQVDLTKREFELLQCLLENQNIVLSRDTLLAKVWGYDYYGDTNSVDVYIRYLRTKIEEPFGRKFISTVRGVGYVIKNE